MEVILKLRRHFSVTVQHKYCTCVINYANGVQIGIYPNHALNSEDAFRAASSLRVSSHFSMPRRKLYNRDKACSVDTRSLTGASWSWGANRSARELTALPVDYDEQRPQGSSHFTISQ